MTGERFRDLRARLMKRLEEYQEVTDQEICRLIDELMLECGRDSYIRLSEREQVRKELFNSVRRLDILQELVDDDTVTEIMVNGTENIYVERQGRLFQWDRKFSSREKLEDIVQQIVAKCNRVAN